MVGFVKGLGCGCCGNTYCTTDDWEGIGPEGAYGSFEYDRIEEFNNGTTLVDVPPWREGSAGTSRMRQAFGYGHNSNNSSDIFAPFTVTFDNVFEVFTRQKITCVQPKGFPPGVRSYYLSSVTGRELLAPIPPSGIGLFTGVETNLGPHIRTTCIAAYNSQTLTFFITAGNINLSFPANVGHWYLGFDLTVDHYLRAISTGEGVDYYASVSFNGVKVFSNGPSQGSFNFVPYSDSIKDQFFVPRVCEFGDTKLIIANYRPSFGSMNDAEGTVSFTTPGSGTTTLDRMWSRVDYHRQTKT